MLYRLIIHMENIYVIKVSIFDVFQFFGQRR